jgi:hypothetical protein
MNKEELNWLLQTMQDTETAKRFVLAQHNRTRIWFQLMADIAPKRGWINRTATQFAITTTRYLTQYATAEFAIGIA